MYGDISHWKRFMATTKIPSVTRSNVPARLRTTAETSVDRPIIIAIVPAIDKRSFQTFMTGTPIDVLTGEHTLIFLAMG
jgi:hypothetical protein